MCVMEDCHVVEVLSLLGVKGTFSDMWMCITSTVGKAEGTEPSITVGIFTCQGKAARKINEGLQWDKEINDTWILFD